MGPKRRWLVGGDRIFGPRIDVFPSRVPVNLKALEAAFCTSEDGSIDHAPPWDLRFAMLKGARTTNISPIYSLLRVALLGNVVLYNGRGWFSKPH